MSNPSLDQAFHLLGLVRGQSTSLENLQALYALGVVSDVFGVEDLSRVNREAVRIALGYDPSVFRVKMGGPETIDQITAALGFPFNDWITQANFPLTPSEAPWEDEIEIIDPGCSFSEAEGLQFLKDAKLGRPTYAHGIRFGQQFGKATTSAKKPFIVFLHEAWLDPNRHRRVLYIDRFPASCVLDLRCPDDRFGGHCVLAGVRPRK